LLLLKLVPNKLSTKIYVLNVLAHTSLFFTCCRLSGTVI